MVKRKSEDNTHLIVVSFGNPNDKQKFIDWVFSLNKENPKISEAPYVRELFFFDINFKREDKEEFLKEFSKICWSRYFGVDKENKFFKFKRGNVNPIFIRTLQQFFKLFGYKPFKEQLPERAKSHKLLTFVTCPIAIREEKY